MGTILACIAACAAAARAAPPATAPAGPADARQALLVRSGADREKLKASPAPQDRSAVLAWQGPAGQRALLALIRHQARPLILTAIEPFGGNVPGGVAVPGPGGTAAGGSRIVLDAPIYRRHGVQVLPIRSAASRLPSLTYAGPQWLRFGDRLLLLTPAGARPGKLSRLSGTLDEDILPGEPTAGPMVMEMEGAFDPAGHIGAPVLLEETGTVIGVLVGGQQAVDRTWGRFELLYLGCPEDQGPLGLAIFGVLRPANLTAGAMVLHRRLFPTSITRAAAGMSVSDLAAARPYLHRQTDHGWERLGRQYLFDLATFHWDDGVISKVMLETRDSELKTPGDAEAARTALAWCVVIFGTPTGCLYENRPMLFAKRTAYDLCYTWRRGDVAAYFYTRVAAPELTCRLAIAPTRADVARDLPILASGKDVGLKPLDDFAAREFYDQWIVRTLAATADHAASQPAAGP